VVNIIVKYIFSRTWFLAFSFESNTTSNSLLMYQSQLKYDLTA